MTLRHLDTSAFSRLMRGDAGTFARISALDPEDLLRISSIVRGEIRYGLERLPAGRRREDLLRRAESLFRALGSEDVDLEIADAYGRLKRAAELVGRATAENDLWIAACAVARGAVLVTADRDLHELPGLTVEDWWQTDGPPQE